jgi:hypothetical protein
MTAPGRREELAPARHRSALHACLYDITLTVHDGVAVSSSPCAYLTSQIASTPPGPPPSSPITAAVTRAGGAKFAAVLKALNVTSPSDPSKINGALLVPSDAAITAWLREMGLSDSDLMARPQLLDLVASYHFVPYWNASAIPAAGRGSVKAFTGARSM